MTAARKLKYVEDDLNDLNKLLFLLMRKVNKLAFELMGNTVIGGPFIGMIIPDGNEAWDDGNSGTKLLGCYEWELHAPIKAAIERKPRTIINVGCAEGFYAIGLARLIKEISVIAFDTDYESLRLCEKFARLNSVDQKIICGNGCEIPEQMQCLGSEGHRFYLIDCEGAELKLIDPERCPQLRTSDLIIECHDFLQAGISKVLMQRLSATHSIEVVETKLLDLNQFNLPSSFTSIMSALLAVEKRPMPCRWLVCWANTRGD